MTITVTAEMIARGERCHGANCPTALAFKAAGFDVMVVTDQVDFYDSHGIVCATLPLPASVQRFIRKFDDSGDRHWAPPTLPEFAPFQFEMPGLEPGVEPFTHFRSVALAPPLAPAFA